MDKLTAGTLTPAYGRDYTKAADAIADFEAGKDFTLNLMGQSGTCGKDDFAPGARISFRFKKLTKQQPYVVK